MNHLKQKTISLLLVLSLLTALLSTGAAAADAFSDDDGTGNWTWAAEYIYACAEEGIINGYTDGTFRIDSNLTRAEAAKLIASAFGLTGDASVSSFSDVAETHWALSLIEACADAGIINGYEDGTFRPDSSVTRAEMAKMIAAAAELSGAGSGSFSDDDGTGNWTWAAEYIYACYAAGIINGYEDGTFRPDSSITRGEASKMIAIAAGLIADAEEDAADADSGGDDSAAGDSDGDDASDDTDAATDRELEALAAAEALLEEYVLSREDLTDWLVELGWTQSEAEYAADHCGADWYEEALKAAAVLLENYVCSEASLTDTLVSDLHFTADEAAYAAEQLDADWNAEALRAAEALLEEDASLSADELTALLEEFGFTAAQAAYAVEAAGIGQS